MQVLTALHIIVEHPYKQIEKVYKHVSDDEKRTFATKRYMNINGNIVAMSDAYGD